MMSEVNSGACLCLPGRTAVMVAFRTTSICPMIFLTVFRSVMIAWTSCLVRLVMGPMSAGAMVLIVELRFLTISARLLTTEGTIELVISLTVVAARNTWISSSTIYDKVVGILDSI